MAPHYQVASSSEKPTVREALLPQATLHQDTDEAWSRASGLGLGVGRFFTKSCCVGPNSETQTASGISFWNSRTSFQPLVPDQTHSKPLSTPRRAFSGGHGGLSSLAGATCEEQPQQHTACGMSRKPFTEPKATQVIFSCSPISKFRDVR